MVTVPFDTLIEPFDVLDEDSLSLSLEESVRLPLDTLLVLVDVLDEDSLPLSLEESVRLLLLVSELLLEDPEELESKRSEDDVLLSESE